MKIICSWCKKFIGEKEPLDDRAVSHAKCSECLQKEIKEKARRDNNGKKIPNLSS